jgi:hypothetical protein
VLDGSADGDPVGSGDAVGEEQPVGWTLGDGDGDSTVASDEGVAVAMSAAAAASLGVGVADAWTAPTPSMHERVPVFAPGPGATGSCPVAAYAGWPVALASGETGAKL